MLSRKKKIEGDSRYQRRKIEDISSSMQDNIQS